MQLDPGKYGLVFYQRFLKANAVLVMDVGMETVVNALDNMNFGENSYKAVVIQDGREIIFQETIGDDGNLVQQEVTATLSEQVQSVSGLNKKAEQLILRVQELEQASSRFQIEKSE